MLTRAYSVIDIKSVNDEQRVIEGIASTPRTDRVGDVVEPMGAQFKVPLPLLLDHTEQVGHVEFAKLSKNSISFRARIPKITEPGAAKDLVDKAWHLAKYGLRQFASIGFRALENGLEPIKSGVRIKSWEWLELSLVQIPAQPDAVITTLKSLDADLLAASGRQKQVRVVKLDPPGASGRKQSEAQEGEMKTIAEQITALENKRAASATAAEAVMQKSLDEDRTTDAAEQESFDNLNAEIEAIDKDLVRLRQVERMKALAAKPITKATTTEEGSAARSSSIIVKAEPKLAPGIAYARMVRCMLLSREQYRPPADIARDLHGPDSIIVRELQLMTKAPVPAGSTITGNWAANLVGEETGAVADFVEYLRASTILGRFGTGGIPALRSVMFRVPLITQTGGGEGYWVGEGKAKPLTSLAFTRTTLEPLKVANICALTNESIRYSSPKSDVIVRDSLAAALRERLDEDFINPAKTAVAGISPASITNGADTVASSGDTADDVRMDIRALWAKYTAANNPPSSGVWVMSSNNAVALAMLTNPLGQPEFGTMSMSGGTLGGMPVIASDYVSSIVVLLNASDIYLADEGGIDIKSSTEASLEMSDAPAHDSITPTGASLVSMFQTNSTAILAERTVNWLRRRDPSVVYLTGVTWGGEVPTA